MMLIQALPCAQERPAIYKLGETNAEINIDSAEENTNAAISLAKQSSRNINIFTQDLDSAIYDNDDFVNAISKLAISDSRSIIRVLIHDSMRAVKSEHKLLKLAQTMPDSVFIRNPTRLYQHIRCSYMVVDHLAYIYRDRPQHFNFDASVNFMSPRRAATLDDNFMEIWEKSTIDRNVRRLYM